MSAKALGILGTPVVKAAQNLPQTATANLFAVTGTVLVTGLIGLVTTAIGATATNLSLGTNQSNIAIGTATAITSKVIGTCIVPQNSSGAGGALLAGSGATFITPSFGMVTPFFLGGVANITWTTSASDTGQIQWYLWYVPIDLDAAVT